MRKNCVRDVIVHVPDDMDFHTLSDKINELHAEVIERRLKNCSLTAREKIIVIDQIIKKLQSREQNGVIK